AIQRPSSWRRGSHTVRDQRIDETGSPVADVSARMQPRGEKAVGLDAGVRVERNTMLAEQALQAPVLEHVQRLRAAADELAANEHPRDGPAAGAGGKSGVDLSAAAA